MGGLYQAFESNPDVYCFFAEPVDSPCCTLSLASGLGSSVAVSDIGLDGKTEADGLAVPRASQVSIELVEDIIAGSYTVADEELFVILRALVELEGPESFMEPSCCAGPAGIRRMREASCAAAKCGDAEKAKEIQRLVETGVHVFWATGGSLVPEKERQELLLKYT